MIRLLLQILWCIAFLIMVSWCGSSLSGADESTMDYQPTEEDFRPVYNKDKKNQKRQPWKSYWGWVETFYNGSALDPGWTKRSESLIDHVKDEEAKVELRRELDALGRVIAAEWAKDNSVRQVSSADLGSLGSRMQVAKKKDDGTGAALVAEIRAVKREVQKKTSKR